VSLLPFDRTNAPSSCQIHLSEEYKTLDMHQSQLSDPFLAMAVLISVKE